MAWVLGAGAWLGAGTLVWAGSEDGPKMERQIERIEIARQGGGYLGVGLRDVSSEDALRLKLAEESGALVVDVRDDSPAAKAGLKDDDVILRYQGARVESAMQLQRLVRETPPARKVQLEISRQGMAQKIAATLGERKDGGAMVFEGEEPDAPERVKRFEFRMPNLPEMLPEGDFSWRWRTPHGPRKLGIEFQEIEGQLAAYFAAKGERAVLVTSVANDGPAAKAGLKAGDVLVQLDGHAISSTEGLMKTVGGIEPGATVKVTVLRQGKELELNLISGGATKPAPPAKKTKST
jgi:serine protease Do